MEEMKKLMEKVLEELKWHTTQHTKMIDLLGKLRQPCGAGQPAQVAEMMKVVDKLQTIVGKSNPGLNEVLSSIKGAVESNPR